jgi:biopolymer transport protein ExbD
MALSPLNNSTGSPLKGPLMAEINITPMVDVMLVLLIIFMVASPLLVAGVKVDLAKTSAPKIEHPSKPVIITATADGALYVGDESISKESLTSRLANLKAQAGDGPIFLRADRTIPYGNVLELLAKIGKVGFQRVSLLSQQDNEKAGLEHPADPGAPAP